MLGRKVDLKPLQDYLKKNNVVNVRITEFAQGKTMRWGIAWSFSTFGLQELIVKQTETTETNRNKPKQTNK